MTNITLEGLKQISDNCLLERDKELDLESSIEDLVQVIMNTVSKLMKK